MKQRTHQKDPNLIPAPSPIRCAGFLKNLSFLKLKRSERGLFCLGFAESLLKERVPRESHTERIKCHETESLMKQRESLMVGGGDSHEEERATRGRASLIKWRKSHDEELEKKHYEKKESQAKRKESHEGNRIP
jgi:hypothetical protein